jgi:pilus assembly protein CpaF
VEIAMPSLTLHDPRTGSTREIPLKKAVVRLGKHPDNDIPLEQVGISRQHCEIRRQDGRWLVHDLGSRNGTFLDGERIEKSAALAPGASIQVGDYVFTFSDGAAPKGGNQGAQTQPKPAPAPKAGSAGLAPAGEEPRRTPPELKKRIHNRLLERLDLKHTEMSEDAAELRKHTSRVCQEIVRGLEKELPPWLNPDALVKEIVDEAIALGPLEELVADDEVTEIMVVGWDKVYVERSGKVALSPKQFTDNNQVLAVIRRILAPIGRRIDETTPMQDGRLHDGSRVNAIIPPLALTGPTLTIRKFSRDPFGVDDLIGFGSLTGPIARFLETAVRYRRNILISGGTGSGKTTLLNVLSGFIPFGERIVTVEDAAELQLPQEHVVRLESRPPNLEGRNAITIRDLVRNSLRMRPDRIVVGECRGGEALDMLQAMNTGHDGSLTTLHANSPRDAISRLETLVLMAGMELPSRAIREQISSAINIIVQISRLSDGTRKCMKISTVTGMEGDVVSLQDLFEFHQEGFDAQGNVAGHFSSTGIIPDFIHDLRRRGIEIDIGMFQESE